MKIKRILVLGLSLILSNLLFAHDDAYKPEFVDTLINPYLTIQKALAADDLSGAQAGAKSFLSAMEEAPEGSKRISGTNEELNTPASAIANASDIKAAREAFGSLSKEMGSLVKHVGVSGDESLYLVHCPMAFGGKGGDWIQTDKSVANPYYGSKMLRCGSVKEQLAGKPEASHDEHAGHMH